METKKSKMISNQLPREATMLMIKIISRINNYSSQVWVVLILVSVLLMRKASLVTS
jgi:hypothetical protein